MANAPQYLPKSVAFKSAFNSFDIFYLITKTARKMPRNNYLFNCVFSKWETIQYNLPYI